MGVTPPCLRIFFSFESTLALFPGLLWFQFFTGIGAREQTADNDLVPDGLLLCYYKCISTMQL